MLESGTRFHTTQASILIITSPVHKDASSKSSYDS